MRDSKTWWEETKGNPEAFTMWLKDQYHGEITAAQRIAGLAAKVANEEVKATLRLIAKQEATHARWVRGLLETRGIAASILKKETRYWSKTLLNNYTTLPVEKLAAIGAHAEAMRLERIQVIAEDASAPADVRMVFQAILPDELFHEEAFRKIAGDENMRAAVGAHKEGLAALGLTI